MKIATYLTEGVPVLGVVEGGKIRLFPGLSVHGVIEAGPVALKQLRSGWGDVQVLDPSRLLAPIPEPRRNVICVGLNYKAHAAESAAARGKELRLPDRPVFFTKITTAVNGPYAEIPLPTKTTRELDWEVELGFVIGWGGKDIPREQALAHVFGYLVVNDISARDVQRAHGGQFFKGKSLDGCCPMGPWIITADEIPNPHALRLSCWVNGELKQEANTADFIFSIPELIEWLSQGMTLLPGDFVATGTPSGVGFARVPPEFLSDGDIIECEIENIGRLQNRVVMAS